jgi:hypothetical protein
VSEVIEFRGDAWRLTKCWAVGLIAAGALFGWILLGPIGLRVSAVAVIAAIPFLALVALVINRWDVVRFDDEAGEISAPGRPRIKYSDLRAVRISDVFWLLSVRLGKRRWRAASFLIAGSGSDRTAIEEALKQRCPEVKIRRALWIERYAPIAAAAIILCAYGCFQFFVSADAASCEAVAIGSQGGAARAPTVRIGEWQVAAPEGFAVTDNGAGFAELRAADGVRVVMSEISMHDGAASATVSGGWFKLLTGLNSVTGWIGYSVCSEQGIVPGLLRRVMLGTGDENERPRVTLFSRQSLESVAIIEPADTDYRAQIWVARDGWPNELQVTITSPVAIDDDLPAAIVAGIE